MNRRKINTRSTLLKWLPLLAALLLIAAYALRPGRASGSPAESSADDNRQLTGLLEVKGPADKDSRIIEYNGFRLSFNSDRHIPDWAAWELLASETDGDVSRTDNFRADTDVEGSATPDDYRRSGFDRGHIVPAADQKWSLQAMEDCFLMTNICPQDHGLNSGAWNTLEKMERRWALRDSAIIIIAGPICLSPAPRRIGQSGVVVPDAFFKVVAAPYGAEPKGIGFIFPNAPSPGNIWNYALPIDEVERQTGYDFLHRLPDNIETAVESTFNTKAWQ